MTALLRLLLLALCLAWAPGAGSTTPNIPNDKRNSEDALPREVVINGVELVLIPAGWFAYTVSIADDIRVPAGARLHREARVWLDSFYIAKYEARARDFARFMNAGAASPETLARQEKENEKRSVRKEVTFTAEGDKVVERKIELPECTVRRGPDGAWFEADAARDLPATNMSWALANEFAAWMGLRLPTEAEWQKAARGDTDRRAWPWGDTYPDDTHALYGWITSCAPAPVDAYPKGRSPYGLYNMAGNVSEYVADWFNQGFDDGIKDGMRNPPLAMEGSPIPDDVPKKISMGGLWSRDAVWIRIQERREVRPFKPGPWEGTRFAADIATVRAHLERGTAHVVESK